MLYVGLEPASEHVAPCLQVEPGTEVIARRKIMFANDVPVRIATSFFRADLVGDTRIAKPDQAGLREAVPAGAIVALGYTSGHAEETLTAQPATQFEAETLELDPGKWVVQVLRGQLLQRGHAGAYSGDDLCGHPPRVPHRAGGRRRRVLSLGRCSDNFLSRQMRRW